MSRRSPPSTWAGCRGSSSAHGCCFGRERVRRGHVVVVTSGLPQRVMFVLRKHFAGAARRARPGIFPINPGGEWMLRRLETDDRGGDHAPFVVEEARIIAIEGDSSRRRGGEPVSAARHTAED